MPVIEKRKNGKTTQAIVAGDKKNIKKPFLKRLVFRFFYNYLAGLARYLVVRTGKIPSFFIRNFFYRFFFNMDISRKTIIYGGCEIRSPWNFHAKNCVMSNNCLIDARNGIFLEDYVVIGAGVRIWTEEHNIDDELFRVLPQNKGEVRVHKRAWICSDSTILPGITVGEGAVLASKACATKNLDSFGVYAGIPAKRIRDRNPNISYELNGKPTYNFY